MFIHRKSLLAAVPAHSTCVRILLSCAHSPHNSAKLFFSVLLIFPGEALVIPQVCSGQRPALCLSIWRHQEEFSRIRSFPESLAKVWRPHQCPCLVGEGGEWLGQAHCGLGWPCSSIHAATPSPEAWKEPKFSPGHCRCSWAHSTQLGRS